MAFAPRPLSRLDIRRSCVLDVYNKASVRSIYAEGDGSMSRLCVWLPFPPSVNNLFSQAAMRSRKTGAMVVRRFPTAAYKRWQRDAQVLLMAARTARTPRATLPVTIKLGLVPPDKRARDADNYCKPVLDALVEAGVLPDDSNRYVGSVVPVWHAPDRKQAGVTVVIELPPKPRRSRFDRQDMRQGVLPF